MRCMVPVLSVQQQPEYRWRMLFTSQAVDLPDNLNWCPALHLSSLSLLGFRMDLLIPLISPSKFDKETHFYLHLEFLAMVMAFAR